MRLGKFARCSVGPRSACSFPILSLCLLQSLLRARPLLAMSSGGVAALPSGAVAPLAPCEAISSVGGPLAPWRPPCVDVAALAAAPDGAERLAAAIAASAPQGVMLLANALPAPFEAIGELFGRVTPEAGARANAGALRGWCWCGQSVRRVGTPLALRSTAARQPNAACAPAAP